MCHTLAMVWDSRDWCAMSRAWKILEIATRSRDIQDTRNFSDKISRVFTFTLGSLLRCFFISSYNATSYKPYMLLTGVYSILYVFSSSTFCADVDDLYPAFRVDLNQAAV